MNALADGPNFGLAGQSSEGFDRIIGHHVVKLTHQSLVGSENDRANGAGVGLSFPFRYRSAARFPESMPPIPVPRCDSSRPTRCTDFSYCPMLDAATAFIVRTTDWRSPAPPIFRRILAVVSLMASSRVRAWAWRRF